jgi:hypothetical protein
VSSKSASKCRPHKQSKIFSTSQYKSKDGFSSFKCKLESVSMINIYILVIRLYGN